MHCVMSNCIIVNTVQQIDQCVLDHCSTESSRVVYYPGVGFTHTHHTLFSAVDLLAGMFSGGRRAPEKIHTQITLHQEQWNFFFLLVLLIVMPDF